MFPYCGMSAFLRLSGQWGVCGDRKFLFHLCKSMDVLLNQNICLLSEWTAFSGSLT